MENNRVDEVQVAIDVNAGESPSPGKRITRRRFVQSTLFPRKSPEKKDVRDGGGVDGGEDEKEGCCGSQGRGKRKHTPGRKMASQPRRAKRVAENGKVAFQELMDEKNSPGEASPEMQKDKKRASTRGRRTNVIQNTSTRMLPDHTTLNDHISHPVPDLRLEAKKTAEEDSRRFAGKQQHPFFSSWKLGRKNRETANPAEEQNFAKEDKKNVECGPIHVYETLKDNNIISVDWRNWAFHDKVYYNPNCHKQSISSTSDGLVESLRIHKILHPSNSLGELCLDHESASREEAANKARSPSTPHYIAEPCQRLEAIDMDHQVAEHIFRSENSSCLVSVPEQDNSASQEWLPYSFRRTNQPQNSLWICKYQPEKAVEVCGNAEPVKLINDWLCLWRERDLQNCKQRSKSEKCSMEEDCSSYYIDSDVESINEEAGLKNVLLVMGPVGSGKTAAIYACAKEQGFKVMEVNSSDWRSGALMKQRFGEAVGMHWLKGSPDNPKALQSMIKRNSSLTALSNASAADEFDEDAIKLIPIPDDGTANSAVMLSQKSVGSEANIRDLGEVTEMKTLILFEDVDATLFEDRGFIATIQQLAQTAKRPMILTSNNSNPVLPESLDREEIYFSIPSQKELLHHVCMVCVAEKSNADPHVIEKYIKYCQGDVRKTLMHLQFWCQGQEHNARGHARRIYSPLMFDLEAGHEILSKIIPWGFSSQLSEHIEMDIAKSAFRMEKHHGLFEVSDEVENPMSLDEHHTKEGLMATIEAKKQAILTSNFISDDNDLITQVANANGVSNSESPVAFSRRRSCRKLGLVLFDSDDEISNYELPGDSDKLCRDNDGVLTADAIDRRSQIRWPAVDGLLNPPNGQPLCSAGNKLVESWHQCSLTANENEEVCHSGSVSCVPESTFVPETEVRDGTEISAGEYQREVLSPIVIVENASQHISKLDKLSEATESQCNRNVTVVDDEVGDSQNGCEESANFTRGYQVLDECSRMDFCRVSRRLKKCNSNLKTNLIQETWKELRCTDFRPHITKEDRDASQAMRLASGMCNLIAEADLLLHDYRSLTTESFEPGMNIVEDVCTVGSHDQQLQMTSAIAEHGYCIFAKDVAALGSRIGLASTVDIAWEMLASTNNSMALGKLLRHGWRTDQKPFHFGWLDSGSTVIGNNSCERDRKTSLHEIVHSVVPPKCLLSLRGSALKEYLSTLAHMSRSEASRAAETPDNTRRRRKRVPRNYLCSGSFCLSPEDISSLVAYKCSRKCPSETTEVTRNPVRSKVLTA